MINLAWQVELVSVQSHTGYVSVPGRKTDVLWTRHLYGVYLICLLLFMCRHFFFSDATEIRHHEFTPLI